MAARVPSVVVVGGTYVDVAIRCDTVPYPGQNVEGSALSYSATGHGTNQAVQAALCGCRVRLISKVGGDPFGQMVKTALAGFGVNTDFVYTAEAKNTGTVITLVNSEGENAACTCTGANSALTAADIDAAADIIAEADACLIHGRMPQAAITTAIRCAKLGRTKVIIDPAKPIDHPQQTNNDLPIDYFTDNILIPNIYEAADIADHSAANIRAAKLIASDIVARGAEVAVITMGRRGCMVVDRNSADHISAFEIDLVDKTCTGDAFAGAIAASCAVGDDIRSAVRFASAAGALTCTKFGSAEALPTKAEIIELLQKEDIE